MTLQHSLTPLVGSRICHDLINPLGAISNGVELLNMTPGAGGPEITLISESVEAANSRIRFFRVAYGGATESQVLEDGEISEILSGMSAGARQTMTWSASGSHPRREVRLIFLLIQCLETSMPYGGTIEVTGHKGAWQVKGVAEKFAEVDDLWNIILKNEEPETLSAAHVQFALVAMLENEMQLSVRKSKDVDTITLNVIVD